MKFVPVIESALYNPRVASKPFWRSSNPAECLKLLLAICRSGMRFCTPIGDIQVEHGTTGFFIERRSGEESSYSRIIGTLIETEEKLRRFNENGIEKCLAEFWLSRRATVYLLNDRGELFCLRRFDRYFEVNANACLLEAMVKTGNRRKIDA